MAATARLVAIVEHVSECDVKETPAGRMPYDDAIGVLRVIADISPEWLAGYDLVYVQPDGTLGRYASWSL